jgi:GNAT superfamily N-acetyltransferase
MTKKLDSELFSERRVNNIFSVFMQVLDAAFVRKEHRKRGCGAKLMEIILDENDTKDLCLSYPGAGRHN